MGDTKSFLISFIIPLNSSSLGLVHLDPSVSCLARSSRGRAAANLQQSSTDVVPYRVLVFSPSLLDPLDEHIQESSLYLFT